MHFFSIQQKLCDGLGDMKVFNKKAKPTLKINIKKNFNSILDNNNQPSERGLCPKRVSKSMTLKMNGWSNWKGSVKR